MLQIRKKDVKGRSNETEKHFRNKTVKTKQPTNMITIQEQERKHRT